MLSRKSVLIVDDEADIRSLLADAFIKAGFTVDTAATGLHGLTKVKSAASFDVIIMDLKMPKMDGVTFYQHAKKITPASVFVMFTGYPEKNKLFKAFQSGLVHVILKPTRPLQVAEEVESYLLKQKNDVMAA